MITEENDEHFGYIRFYLPTRYNSEKNMLNMANSDNFLHCLCNINPQFTLKEKPKLKQKYVQYFRLRI